MGIHIEKDNVPFLNILVSNPQTRDNSNHGCYSAREGRGEDWIQFGICRARGQVKKLSPEITHEMGPKEWIDSYQGK